MIRTLHSALNLVGLVPGSLSSATPIRNVLRSPLRREPAPSHGSVLAPQGTTEQTFAVVAPEDDQIQRLVELVDVYEQRCNKLDVQTLQPTH